MTDIDFNNISEKIKEFTPTRLFLWFLAICFSTLLPFVIILFLLSVFKINTNDTEEVLRQNVIMGAILFSVTAFQIPVFLAFKFLSFRAILLRIKKSQRIYFILLASLFLTMATTLLMFLLNLNWLGSSISSIIAMLIAIPIGMVDAILYVFFMGKIFTSTNDFAGGLE